MIDREQLTAWANTLPDDLVKSAVRDAAHKAIDNIDGDGDEHHVFYVTLFSSLGGKRSKGTPRKDRFDADLIKFRRWAGRNILPGEIATALEIKGATRATSLSRYTIRNRLRAIDEQRNKLRQNIEILLSSPIAEHGRSLLRAAIDLRDRSLRNFQNDTPIR